MQAGFQVEKFIDADRNRPVLVDLWYPVVNQPPQTKNYGLAKGYVVESGEIAEGTFPLVLLSHGAMGAARDYAWIAEALARNGFVVAGISHFAESYAFGLDTVDPAAVLRLWERPLDISAALSHIADRSVVSSAVDMDRVGFLGHSSGGATAMSLAGVLFDGDSITEYCNSPASSGDKGCDYASASSPAIDLHLAEEDYTDRRIRAFVALDPALGPGFTDFSRVDPELRVLFVGSVENDFLPFQHHAQRLAGHFPNAASHWLDDGEGHFIYLNTCDADIRANGVPLCVDRPGVSRQAVHDKLKITIHDFFDTSLQRED
ncbi:MAG: hypothetical protein RJQ07_13175 [Pseudomonadales bacterium]